MLGQYVPTNKVKRHRLKSSVKVLVVGLGLISFHTLNFPAVKKEKTREEPSTCEKGSEKRCLTYK